MKTTDFNEILLDQQDVFDGLYSGKITSLDSINLDNKTVNQFNQARQENADPFPLLYAFEQTVKSIEEFDRQNQNNWFMPEEYKTYDIVDYLYSQCRTIEQKERVTEELTLFAQHNFIMVLKYLKYLVDTMRKHNIVWGVGRGSSVASYCLYLLGIHRVDSIKYDLDIHEFLKGELK
jgi:DNA polymerase III alpha subunit